MFTMVVVGTKWSTDGFCQEEETTWLSLRQFFYVFGDPRNGFCVSLEAEPGPAISNLLVSLLEEVDGTLNSTSFLSSFLSLSLSISLSLTHTHPPSSPSQASIALAHTLFSLLHTHPHPTLTFSLAYFDTHRSTHLAHSHAGTHARTRSLAHSPTYPRSNTHTLAHTFVFSSSFSFAPFLPFPLSFYNSYSLSILLWLCQCLLLKAFSTDLVKNLLQNSFSKQAECFTSFLSCST